MQLYAGIYEFGIRRDNIGSWADLTFHIAGNMHGTAQFPLNKWVFVTGTYNKAAGIECLYVNGKLDSEDLQLPNLTPVVPLDPTQNPGIGIGTNNNFPNDFYNMGWNGAISDLRVYNRAISAGEVQSLYSQTVSHYQ